MTTPISVDLSGTTSLVTGSSRGLGRATALRLAASGADVVVTYRRNADQADEVAAEITGMGRRAIVAPLDLEDGESIDALFATVADEVGHLDHLILNAAATSFRPLLDASPKHLRRTYEISCVGFLHSVQAALPLLESRGGTIIGVSGADTRTLIAAHGVLAGAKAAMETMIRYLAEELGPRGVTILGVNPGTVLGDSMKIMLGDMYPYAIESEERTHPMREGASPDDIAEPIAMLCTAAARWVHGSIVDLDGGSAFSFSNRYMHESMNYFMLRDGLAGADGELDLGPSMGGQAT